MALGLGATNPIPFTLGGGDSFVEQEQQLILSALDLGLDPDASTGNYAEAYAEATAISMIWACDSRLANQAIPERMMENLAVWEQACGLRPTVDDLDIDRRGVLSAKLRSTAGNAMGDIASACKKILGANFVAVHLTAPVNWIVYWPGVNPGPPGFEWSSNRARISVQMTESGLGKKEFDNKRAAVVNQLDAMLPVWMTFQIGVGTAFIANVGIVGKTLV
jgi:hypothetical protein